MLHPYTCHIDNEYSFIYDDFFDKILETDINSDIVTKVINKDVALPPINDNGSYASSKLSNSSEFVSPCCHIQRKRQKKFIIIHRNRLMSSS